MDKKKQGEIINIILADDHPLFRKGVRDTIEEQGWNIVGEAGDGEKAIELTNVFIDAILVTDIEMPKLNGLDVVKEIGKNKTANKVIVLTMHTKENIFNYAMDLGVLGYVVKDSADTEIIEAIKNVSEGKHYISPSISGYLVKGGKTANDIKDNKLSALTATEKKILKMIMDKMTTKDIANELFISVHTIERHRANICQKLDLHGTNALLRFALENKDIF